LYTNCSCVILTFQNERSIYLTCTLACLLQALARAGHRTTRSSDVAVVVGIASAEYNSHLAARFGPDASAYSATGGAVSVSSGRLSYTFAFTAPALSVDTACSSSLVGIHLAAGAIYGGAATAGLAAGVGLLLNPATTATFQKAGMLALDGRCKTLDAAADGYVRGEAAGVLFFRPLGSSGGAIVGGEPQGANLALFVGSAVNQDGRSSALTAPNGPAQQAAIRAALSSAKASAADVAALQMHGTGTPLGDPIEVGAASAALVDGVSRAHGPLAASTAKSWIGHTEAAAGAMGLTQAAVATSHHAALGKISFYQNKREHSCVSTQ
jgi:acyl transferase domain-containing protein